MLKLKNKRKREWGVMGTFRETIVVCVNQLQEIVEAFDVTTETLWMASEGLLVDDQFTTLVLEDFNP